MKKVAVYTLGCKVNQYDSQAMCEILERDGYTAVPFSEKADVVLINTCTVTSMADKKSRQIVARAVKNNPGAVICVCGCMVQNKPEKILSMDGVSCVVGVEDRSLISEIIKKAENEKINAVKETTDVFEDMTISKPGFRTRASIKIQEGCNNFCSYCIIPYVRGRERSRDAVSIMAEAEKLCRNSVSEIVLTGIHESSYSYAGKDLADIVMMLSEVAGVKRIRLGSLEQPALNESFIKRLAESDVLCPHFHISLQSGCDKILEKMNRRYKAGEYFETVSILRRYFDNPAITTDVITGFPGETEEDFADTENFVKKIGFARMHVFPYSEREGTKAAEMECRIPVNIRRERANILIETGRKMELSYLKSMVGRYEEVLLEQKTDDGFCTGYTTRYVHVKASGNPGQYKKVLLSDIDGDIIIGRKIEQEG